jgi:DNA-binding CsgD family transcriptional regulator
MANLSILTPREMEMLLLLFTGRSNRSSAAEIFISEKILAFYLDYIRTKMDAETHQMARTWKAWQESKTETREIPREIADVRRL